MTAPPTREGRRAIRASTPATDRSRFGCPRISMPISMLTPAMVVCTPMVCLCRPSETPRIATAKKRIRYARNSEKAAARCGLTAATARSIFRGKQTFVGATDASPLANGS